MDRKWLGLLVVLVVVFAAGALVGVGAGLTAATYERRDWRASYLKLKERYVVVLERSSSEIDKLRGEVERLKAELDEARAERDKAKGR